MNIYKYMFYFFFLSDVKYYIDFKFVVLQILFLN